MLDNSAQGGEPFFRPEDMVNASELREFLFCERAWFLSRQGLRVSEQAQAQRAAGIVFHEARAGAQPVDFLACGPSRRRQSRNSALSTLAGQPMTLMPVLIAAALLLAAVFLFLFARDQRRLG